MDELKEAIDELKKGNFIILLDDKKREGEGDLIAVARYVTPDMINFMVTNARGAFIAVFLEQEQADKMNLPAQLPMQNNQEFNKTNFCISCDTKYGKSGCSAHERSETVNILSGYFNDGLSKADDLVRPGHIIPIVAQGLDKRQGHTDGAVELMKRAGIEPAVAVDMEILAPDGSMAREEYLKEFAKKHNLKMIEIKQLI
jgi:3,4-dihydroxy 2-butanone 4-phosphate synthase/GTP cyclohydrolase II